MVGLAEREAAACQRCGGDLVETLDYDFQWVPQPPLVCMRCVGLHVSQEAHAHDANSHSMIHLVTKRPRPTPKSRKRKRR